MSTITLGGQVNTIPDQRPGTRRRRRLHSDEFKAGAGASCMQRGMSMAAVAMAHGVNANLLRRWVRESDMKPPVHALSTTAGQQVQGPQRETLFVPVSLPASAAPTPLADIRIELQCGATTLTFSLRPGSICSAFDASGRRLLFDADHLSRRANLLLVDEFIKTVRQLVGPGTAVPGRSAQGAMTSDLRP